MVSGKLPQSRLDCTHRGYKEQDGHRQCFFFGLKIAKIRPRFWYFTIAWGKIWCKMGFLAKIHSIQSTQ
jgi:hypothetical protein